MMSHARVNVLKQVERIRNATLKGDLKAGSVPYNVCFPQPLQCGATCCLSGKHDPNE